MIQWLLFHTEWSLNKKCLVVSSQQEVRICCTKIVPCPWFLCNVTMLDLSGKPLAYLPRLELPAKQTVHSDQGSCRPLNTSFLHCFQLSCTATFPWDHFPLTSYGRPIFIVGKHSTRKRLHLLFSNSQSYSPLQAFDCSDALLGDLFFGHRRNTVLDWKAFMKLYIRLEALQQR